MYINNKHVVSPEAGRPELGCDACFQCCSESSWARLLPLLPMEQSKFKPPRLLVVLAHGTGQAKSPCLLPMQNSGLGVRGADHDVGERVAPLLPGAQLP